MLPPNETHELEEIDSSIYSDDDVSSITTVDVHTPGSAMYALILQGVEKQKKPPEYVDYNAIAKKYNALMIDGLVVFDVPNDYKNGTIYNALRKRGLRHNADYALRRALPDELNELDGRRRVVMMKLTGTKFRKSW